MLKDYYLFVNKSEKFLILGGGETGEHFVFRACAG
jgi:hypothetical protein